MLETIETISTQDVVLKDLGSYFILMACECHACGTRLEMTALGDTVGLIPVPSV